MTKDEIKALPEVVFTKIAAGEVIHRPCNAIKELLENSLDAGATQISISIQDGGFKSITVQDNGHGIRTSDLAILCRRFTTSKMRNLEDLPSIRTFGFRGEALFSISHVSHLSVTSRRPEGQLAYKAEYIDGELKDAPKPCAGNQGTLIKVDNLFYNMPLRRRTLKSASEEYAKCMEVVVKYAIHNWRVGFVLKRLDDKQTQPSVDVRTPGGTTDRQSVLTAVLGVDLARDMKPFSCQDDTLAFKADGFVSQPKFNCRRFNLVSFVNDRLVDCPIIRTALETIASQLLPSDSQPFIYISLNIRPDNVDVNVHPNKSEVHFMHDAFIVERLEEVVDKLLRTKETSRPFCPKTFESTTTSRARSNVKRVRVDQEMTSVLEDESSGTDKQLNKSPSRVYDRYLDRMDAKKRRLDEFFLPVQSQATSTPRDVYSTPREKTTSALPTKNLGVLTNDKENIADLSNTYPEVEASERDDETEADECENKTIGRIVDTIIRDNVSSEEATIEDECFMSALDNENIMDIVETEEQEDHCRSTFKLRAKSVKAVFRDLRLTSVERLKQEIERSASPLVTTIFADHIPVGPIDACAYLIQHKTTLYWVNAGKASERFYYQTILDHFGNLACHWFEQPLPVAQLIEPTDDEPQRGKRVAQTLAPHAPMLADYFSLHIKRCRDLEEPSEISVAALPALLEGFVPQLERLGDFLLALADNVDWLREEPCFRSICFEMAKFYTLQQEYCCGEFTSSVEDAKIQVNWFMDTVLFPAFKVGHFLAGEDFFTEQILRKVTDLDALYKVFERC